MPEWLDVLILAVIEGITEFLPVSSTGHMLIVQNWLQHKQSELFLAVVQSGAVSFEDFLNHPAETPPAAGISAPGSTSLASGPGALLSREGVS